MIVQLPTPEDIHYLICGIALYSGISATVIYDDVDIENTWMCLGECAFCDGEYSLYTKRDKPRIDASGFRSPEEREVARKRIVRRRIEHRSKFAR